MFSGLLTKEGLSDFPNERPWMVPSKPVFKSLYSVVESSSRRTDGFA